jgi:hypothetical protein
MKKPRKRAAPAGAEPVRWSVFMMRSKATFLCSVARDEAEAMAKAIKQLGVRPADQWRITCGESEQLRSAWCAKLSRSQVGETLRS